MGLPRKLYAKGSLLLEVLIRVSLAVVFVHLEKMSPFKRVIHQDEMWLYRNPITPEYVPVRYLWIAVIIMPLVIFTVFSLARRNKKEYLNSVLGFTLALPLNGTLTNTVKLIVGRPRPDFFWRCFPNGEMNVNMECTGDAHKVQEGRKSFPSGHSSFSFVAMTYLTLYLIDRLQVFTEKGRGQSWRLLISFTPVFGALLVALSRTCDYHHHAEDVLVGSLLGITIGTLCYRQYFPSRQIRTPTRSIRETELLQILESAAENLKPRANHAEDATGEDAKLIASNIKWI